MSEIKTTVAIVLRTRDRAMLLERALESIVGQRFTDWSLVVVNDGGATAPVDAALARRNTELAGRARVIHHTSSRGMEAASNAGLRASDSRYVAIHDDDDAWHPDFLAECVAFLERPGAPPGVITHSVRVDEELAGDRVIELRRDPLFNAWLREVTLLRLAAVNPFPPISFVYRRRVLDELRGYREDLPVLGDWEFNLRFVARHRVGVIPRPLAFYHQRRKTEDPRYGNSVSNGEATHRLWDARLRRELLREDVRARRIGLGALVQVAPAIERLRSSLWRSAPARAARRLWRPADPSPLPEELLALVERHRVLSLDVFDTALLRDVDEPAAVFALVAEQHRRLHGHERAPSRNGGFDFARERMAAEARARVSAWERERRGDVTLDEIHRQLALPPGWDGDELRRLELDAERALSSPNPFLLELFRHTRALGKPVVFTSDMYLPHELLGELLARAGYDPHDGLFVSSAENGRTKHSGELYELVCERLGIARHQLLHVGDHPFADVARALMHGSGAWLYERCAARAARRPPILDGATTTASVLRGLVHNRLEHDRRRADHRAQRWNAHHRFGYARLGPAFIALGGDVRAIARALPEADGLARAVDGSGETGESLRSGAESLARDFARVHASFPWLAVDERWAIAELRAALREQAARITDRQRAIFSFSRT